MNLTNSQYEAVMRVYDRKHFARQALIDERFAEVSAKVPGYASVDNEITGTYAQAARAALAGNRDEAGALRQKAASLVAERTGLLAGAGFPEDYLDPPYECPLCNDTGYINGTKCSCFDKTAAAIISERAGNRSRDELMSADFSDFRTDYYSEETDPHYGISPRQNIGTALSVCREFVNEFPSEGRNLLFYGKTGVGKTFLCSCIANELLKKGAAVVFLSAIRFTEIVRGHVFGQQDSSEGTITEDIYPLLTECDLLVIDDLGTEINNKFTNGQFFYILNERLAAGRSTIISTNLNPEELGAEYSERIFSRIVSCFDIMLILGDDIRLKKAIGGY
ncbi:MAG: ATP-binding protein [Lachnospiraceae bacterium]|nr:ATP-binding protein [Lachnospiraceae bacterium]